MHLTELSKREYIAIDVAGNLAPLVFNAAVALRPTTTDEQVFPLIAEKAYALADALIAFEGNQSVITNSKTWKERLAVAERSNEVLRTQLNDAHRVITSLGGMDQ